MDAKKILIRAASGLVYVVIVVGLLCCGYYGVLALAGILSVLATLEFDRISYGMTGRNPAVKMCDIVANLCLVLTPGPQAVFLLPLWVLILLTRYIMELYLHEPQPLKSLSSSLMSMIYIGFPLMTMVGVSAFTLIADTDGTACDHNPFGAGFHPVWGQIMIFVLIWLNDTGAFLVGSLMGRHKLSARISPKKTWEGFFGGMVFTVAAAIGFGYLTARPTYALTGNHAPMLIWSVYGMMVTLFATWGDLTESLIKRNLGLKDSGDIMPGHGGILDRIDSLLFVMPMTALFLFIVMWAGLANIGIPIHW